MPRLLGPARLLAQDAADLITVCGEDPGVMCRLVLERTGSGTAAMAVDRFLATPFRILLILVVAALLSRVFRQVIDRFVGRMEGEVHQRVERGRELGAGSGSRQSETRRLQRLHAVGGAIRSAVGVVIWLVALLLALSEIFDLAPILAGAGLAGLVVGFGAQNLIRDFLAGIAMLVEDHYGVGDWIDVEGKMGEVEYVGLRTTRMRDIDGVVWHVPNGAMAKVGNLTQRWARATLDVPFALDTDVRDARRIVQEVADGLAADPEWGQDIIAPPEIWGVQEWGPQGLSLRLVIATRPLRNWDVNRQMRERLSHAFRQAGIRMPASIHEVGAQRDGEPIRHRQVQPPPEGRPGRLEPAGEFDLPETTGRIPTTRAPEPDEARATPDQDR